MDTLKAGLTEPPILATFNPKLPTQVHVDASHTALGAVLTQTHGDTTRLVKYTSKKVSDSDSHKHLTELEAIAAHWAITERFHCYLQELEHFELITDNWAVTHIMYKTNPNRRCTRMVLDLSTYHFTVRHISGKTNTMADTLLKMVNAVFVLRANDSRLCELQRKDAKLVTIIKDIEAATETGNQSKSGNSYQIIIGMLMHGINQHWKTIQEVVVPKSLQSALMQSHHDHAGHGDALRTKSKLSKRYYWQNMDQDIAQYVRECRVCQQHNHAIGVQLKTLNPRKVPQTPFHTVVIDHVGPINTADENKRVITAVHAATRFIFTRAVLRKCASHVIQFIEEEVVTKFGVQKTIISDNNSAFTSKTTNDYLHHHHIEYTLTVPYAPRTNGHVERANGRNLPPLRKNVNGDVDHWCEYLAKTTFEVNAMFQAGLKTSPFELSFIYTPRRIIDNELQVYNNEPTQDIEMVRQEAFDNITAYLNVMKTEHDESIRQHPMKWVIKSGTRHHPKPGSLILGTTDNTRVLTATRKLSRSPE
ncbi:hypothetical protein MRX96_039100 [Rhipicephalus microplus]